MPALVNDAGPGLGGYSVLSPAPQVNPNQQNQNTPNQPPDTGTSRASGASFTPGPIPNIDIYARAEVMANNAYDKAVAQLNQNRLNTLTQYGYTGKVDPTTGVVSGVAVDPHSLYGSLQQLLHNQAVEDTSAQNAAQDRGLVGGLAHQAASELRYAHGGQDTALGSDLQSKLADMQTQQQVAAETKDNTLWQAEEAQLNAELQAEYNQEIASLIAALAGGGNGSGDKSSTDTNVPGGDQNLTPNYRDNNPGGVRWTAPRGRNGKPVLGRI